MNRESIVIIGSGPAAWTAAIYAARANLRPLVIEGEPSRTMIPGGQLMTTTEVENLPGFPDSVSGPELVERMKNQALRFETRSMVENVVSIDMSKQPFVITPSYSEPIEALAVVIAGAIAAKLLASFESDLIKSRFRSRFWEFPRKPNASGPC